MNTEPTLSIDWSKIVYRNFESKELDYKGPCVWDEDDKKACCELVKDVLALANTNGGWIVVGVKEAAKGFVHEGLTEQQAQSFDTSRLNRFVQNYADPPINSLVHKPLLDGKIFVVVEVPPFPDAPHVCQKEYPGVLSACAIYVRTDNNESAPLKNTADFRVLVERAVRNRSEQLLTSIRTILRNGLRPPEPPDVEKYEKQIGAANKRCDELNPHAKKPYAYRQTTFFPVRFNADRFDVPTLRKMAHNACVDFRGWPFLFISHSRPDLTYSINDGLEAFIAEQNPFNKGDEMHFWQLRQSGMLFVNQMLWEDTCASVGRTNYIFDFDGLAMSAGEAVHCLVKLYEGKLEDSDDVMMRFQVIGVKDRSLSSLDAGRRPFPSIYACRIPEIRYEEQHPLADWKAGLMDHALAICQYVLVRFNWDTPNLVMCRKVIEDMFARRR